MVHCGCKTLTLSDFAKAVKETHKNNYHAKWYAANIVTMKLIAKNSEEDFKKYHAAQKDKESVKVEAK